MIIRLARREDETGFKPVLIIMQHKLSQRKAEYLKMTGKYLPDEEQY